MPKKNLHPEFYSIDKHIYPAPTPRIANFNKYLLAYPEQYPTILPVPISVPNIGKNLFLISSIASFSNFTTFSFFYKD